MGNIILKTALPFLISRLIGLLTPELLREFADRLLDLVEDVVTKSPNKIDDSVLPVCEIIRITFNIPDND